MTTYLAQTLIDQGYTGATGTTPYRLATTEQLALLQSLYSQSLAGQVSSTASSSAVHININFDGTQNNSEFPATGESPTNVWQLTRLQRDASEDLDTIYKIGIGAQTLPSGTPDANGNPAPDSSQHLGLIPQRMPSLNYRAAEFADKGYSVTDIDPLTGAQRAPFLRFDDQGRLFGVLPEQMTPEERAMLYLDGASNVPALTAYMLNSALQRQAIAPMWEVKTARMQEEVGDPNAGLTEEARAAKCYGFNSYLRNIHWGLRSISLVESPCRAANDACLREAA